MKQPKEYLPSARIRFLDRGKILRELKELSLTLKKDVLVYTEEEIKKMQHEGFIESVIKEGITLG